MASSASHIPSTAYKPPVSGLDPVTVIRKPQTEEGGSSASAGSSGSAAQVNSSDLNRLFPVEQRADQANLPAGLKLGQYVIESRIGAGGMGAVFKARDEQLDRMVALKVLSPSQASDSSAVKRFQNEARAAARLDHDNVARIYAVGEEHGLYFIAFEYVEGVTVRELIRSRGVVDPGETINFMLQISVALKHTAAAGVVHRDIKPSNLILTPQGRAKLVDWGLARKERLDENSLDLTVSGTTLGTFDYISPEQARDPRNVDVRSDIYSLGCTAYHMLTGSPPYAEGTVLQKLLDHQGKNAPDPRDRNPNVPKELSRIVRKMMASNPEERYWTPQALTHDLLVLASESGLRPVHPDGLTWRAPQDHTPGRIPGTLFWWWLGAFAVACVVAIGVDRWTVGQDNPLNPEWPITNKLELPAGDTQWVPPPTSANRIHNRGESGSESNSLISGFGSPLSYPPLPIGDSPRDMLDGIPRPLTAGTSAEDGQSAVNSWNFPGLKPIWEDKNFPERSPGVVSAALSDTELEKSTSRSGPERDDISAQPAPMPEQPFRILASNGDFIQNAEDLESAINAAPDGGVIEHQSTGGRTATLSVRQLRIVDKVISLRASGNSTLILRFDTSTLTEGISRTNEFISIKGGGLTLSRVHLQVLVPVAASRTWSVFGIEGNGRLRCRDSTITLDSRIRNTAAIVRLNRSAMQPLESMNRDSLGEEVARRVQFDDCVLRGSADVIASESSDATSIELTRTLVTVDGALLRYQGDNNIRTPHSQFDVRLARVAGVFNDGVLVGDLGVSIPRQPVETRLRVEDSILIGQLAQPLVQLSGSLENRALRALVSWDGEHNYFGGWERYLLLRGLATTEPPVSLDFEGWREGTSQIREHNPRRLDVVQPTGEIQTDFDKWTARTFLALIPSDTASPSNLSDYGPEFNDLPVPPPLFESAK